MKMALFGHNRDDDLQIPNEFVVCKVCRCDIDDTFEFCSRCGRKLNDIKIPDTTRVYAFPHYTR